jgi:hypothetical protein
MAEHIVLLGDSIFDNGAYTDGLPDVVTPLRRILPEGMTATLLAVDGGTAADLDRQVARLPPDASHAAVSVGGNDAILHADALDLPVSSTGEALRLFGARASTFEASYRTAIAGVLRRVPQTAVCTIYNGNLQGDEAALARVGLMLFNEVILRVAFEWHLPVVDLRLVCVDALDYANAIEPSSEGAAKIAKSIAAALGVVAEPRAASTVFAATAG